MQKIEYYFDFLSPYSYLSWYWVKNNNHHQFEFIPVVLSRVIHHHKTKGPAEIVPKRNFLIKDCLRYAHLKNIPFVIPAQLPFNSLEALRVCLVAKERQFEVIDTLFMAAWAKGMDISQTEVLVELGLGDLVEKAGTLEARTGLRLNQKKAIERDLFGLPSFIVDGELFWGNDSTLYLERFLKGDDYFDKKMYKFFLDIGNW